MPNSALRNGSSIESVDTVWAKVRLGNFVHVMGRNAHALSIAIETN